MESIKKIEDGGTDKKEGVSNTIGETAKIITRVGGKFVEAIKGKPEKIEDEEYSKLIKKNLEDKLSSYYNGITPEILDIDRKKPPIDGFNVSAKVRGLKSESGEKKADLKAMADITEGQNSVVISRIELTITNFVNTPEWFENKMRVTFKEIYPNGELIGDFPSLGQSNEGGYCERLIKNIEKDDKGNTKPVIELVEFKFSNVSRITITDNILIEKSTEPALTGIVSILTIRFPVEKSIRKEILKDKEDRYYEILEHNHHSKGLIPWLFRMDKKITIEPKDCDFSPKNITFCIKSVFSLRQGFRIVQRFTVSYEFVYSIKKKVIKNKQYGRLSLVSKGEPRIKWVM
jgi:hypothetical protein